MMRRNVADGYDAGTRSFCRCRAKLSQRHDYGTWRYDELGDHYGLAAMFRQAALRRRLMPSEQVRGRPSHLARWKESETRTAVPSPAVP